ncbi:MAG: signal peptide peptidase SppA, partial [Flavobacteriales bacterium]|nr:signal peptide peptidase SppA [Flavobacteriales bacterium]
AGTATLGEVRRKLIEFKEESGKPVIAFADGYSQGSYYLASAADAVFLQPRGDLDYRGLQSESMFFKGMFEKLDIDMQFIRGSNNQFKSFGEVFTEDKMSPANREQVRQLLSGIWNEHRSAVSASRGITPEQLDLIADSVLVRNADDALRLGLVDGLLFRDQVLDTLRARLDLPSGKDIRFASLRSYGSSFTKRTARGTGGAAIGRGKLAVIYAEGDIAMGKSSDGTIGGASLSEIIREAREDSTIKAVVLRVNSPGGSGLASEIVHRELVLAKAVKPVVVSMGNVAASGGYYIAAPADRIYASPTTITGSIGVFGMIPNMQGFFNNKLGITFDGEKTHRHADMLTVSRALTPHEQKMIQGFIDDFYDGFLERVAEGRGMTKEAVDAVGQGRVWTGADALKHGLVDELGGLEDAIIAAAELAGLDEYRRVELPRQKDLMEQIMTDLTGNARTWAAHQVLGDDARMLMRFRQASAATGQGGIMARMPFDITIH